MPTFDDRTRRWKERVGGTRDYEIVGDGEDRPGGPVESRIVGEEYDRVQALLRSLQRRYAGRSLQEILSGDVVTTAEGSCYHLEMESESTFVHFGPERTREQLLSDLKLLYGIGRVTEERLKGSGVSTIEDLRNHPHWGPSARRFLQLVDSAETVPLQEWLWRWLPKSHPRALSLAGLHEAGDFLMLDIETMGFFGRPIVLIGLARSLGSTVVVHQYLLRDLEDEPGALAAFRRHLTGRTALVTFNGRAFDLPYIEERLGYYGLEPLPDLVHFDILHFARREWRDRFRDCTLTTLERELFGHSRTDDVPGALVPEFYDTYLRTGNVGPLVPVIEHNRQDVLTLARLYGELCRRWGHDPE